MISQSLSASLDFSEVLWTPICPCQKTIELSSISTNMVSRRRKRNVSRACVIPVDGKNQTLSLEIANSVKKGLKSYSETQISNDLNEASDSTSRDSIQLGYSNDFSGFREDPIVGKLRTQLGVIHPIPLPPINRNIGGMFVFFFVIGVVFDKLWTSRKQKTNDEVEKLGIWPQVPTSFSLFLEKDLQRKESVEWVNMVLGKLWKVYRGGLENWVIGLLQPVIDDLNKPDYVERVEIKQFSLGDEPFVVRNVERRTSRSINDLQ